MLSVDRRPRQKFSMPTGGSFVTERFRSLRKSNILIEPFLPLHVLQHDTDLYTAMTYAYAKWMLHIADFSGQWSGLATWIGHCHGMKFLTLGLNAFGDSLCRQLPNHGRSFVYDTIGMCGTIFRNITWASLDQKNISLACLATSRA